MRWLWIVLAVVGLCCSRPEPTEPDLDHFDVYGSRHLDRAAVIERWHDRLDDLGSPLLAAEIAKTPGIASAKFSTVTYYDPPGTFVTLDLVDSDRQVTFAPAPTGTYADPEGLIQLWRDYEAAFFQLLNAGEIPAKMGPCPFWHCLGFDHPLLVPYREVFAARVPPHERELVAILRDDKRPFFRDAAAFLLAHLPSGDRVVEVEVPAIRDPDSGVRNNALRVLALIAQRHPEIAVPLDPILDALEFPTTVDRNKASATLAGLVDRPGLTDATRERIRARSGDVLVAMLALRQPNNHDFAYRILKRLAGTDLGEHAVDAWRAWVHAR
jgi:hypothetical protein